MEPRPKYAAPRRMRANAPALECQARRTGEDLEVVVLTSKGHPDFHCHCKARARPAS